MEDDIYQVVTQYLVLVEIIVEGKAYIGHRAIGKGAFKGCPGDTFPGEFGQPDMTVVANIGPVIKCKGSFESVGVGKKADKDHAKKPCPYHLVPGIRSDANSVFH